MNWHLGSMGFSYSDWVDVFYPRGTPSSDYLGFYAKSFDAVELDTTFYATPPVERVRKWRNATPDAFRFSAKVPKSVTHELPTPKAVDELHRFVESMRGFEEKLGVLLLQFPPSFEIGQIEKLDALLIAAPKDVRFAVELRDRTWGTQRTIDLLSHHRVALAAAEYQQPPRVIPVTSDFLYVRWIGEHERFSEYGKEHVDMSDRLAWWKDKLLATAEAGVTDIWGFFNNDYAGYSVATCERFKRMLGLPVARREEQRGLFG